jgi:TM2 domain-containing membrane protein YozV
MMRAGIERGAQMLIKCPECQREVSDTAPACPGCGYVFKVVAVAPATPAPPPAAINTQTQMLIEQRITNEGPSAVVAYLLWFFLGLFSGHRFYLGRPGTALLQIVSYFFLIGLVWWVIDAFLIPDMLRSKRDELRRALMNQVAIDVVGNPYERMSSYHDPAQAR